MAAHQDPPSWNSPGKNTGVGCHFLLQCMKVKSESEARSVVSSSFQPHDCSPSVFSVHGILQAGILEWLAVPFSRVSSWPRDWTLFSWIAGRFFTIWATREVWCRRYQDSGFLPSIANYPVLCVNQLWKIVIHLVFPISTLFERKSLFETYSLPGSSIGIESGRQR